MTTLTVPTTPTQAQSDRFTRAISAGTSRAILASVAVSVSVLAFALVHENRARHLQSRYEKMRAAAQTQASLLGALVRERFNDARVLAQVRANWRSLDPRATAATLRAERPRMEQALQTARDAYGYKHALLADAHGTVIAPAGVPVAPDERALWARAVQTGQKVLLPLRRDPDGDLEIGVAEPVFADGDSARAVIGAVVLVQNAATQVLPLLTQMNVEQQGEESALAQVEGDSIATVASTWSGGRPGVSIVRRALTDLEYVTPQLLRSRADTLAVGLDSRGIAVIATASPVPGTPWMLISKVERAALDRETRLYTLLVIFAAATAIVLAAILLRLQWMAVVRHAEAQQYQLAARHLAAMNTSIDGYVLLDAAGRFLDCNPATEQMTGYTREELLARSLHDVKADSTQQSVQQLLELLVERGAVRMQTRWRRKDGSLLDLDVSNAILRTDDGVRLFAFIRDITEQIATTTRLERMNRLYRFMTHASEALYELKSVQDAYEAVCRIAVEDGQLRLAWVGVADETAGVVRVVARAGEASSYTDGLYVPFDAAHPDADGPAARCLREGRPFIVNDFIHSDLTRPWHELAVRHGVRASASVPVLIDGRAVATLQFYAATEGYFSTELLDLFNEISRLLGLVVQSIDTEGRREAEATRRRESEERLRLLFDASPIPLVVVRQGSGRLTLLNRTFTEAFGYSPLYVSSADQLLGALQPESVDGAVRVVDFADAVHVLSASVASEETSPEFRVRCQDGTIKVVRATVSRVADELVVGLTDLTELRSSEQMLESASRIAKVGGWSFDFTTRTATVSPHFFEVLGFDPSIRDLTVNDDVPWLMNVWHPDDVPTIIDTFRLSDDMDAVYRARPRWEGDERYLQVRASTERRDDRIVRAVGSYQDVTAEVTATRELTRLRDHLQEVVDERTAELAKANATLQMTDKRLKAMLAMSQRASTLGEAEILQLGIDEATRFTASAVGYVHLVSRDQLSMVGGTWSHAAEGASAPVPHTGAYPFAIDGIWADAVRTRQPIVINESDDTASQRGVMTVPTSLHRHLVVPIISDDRVQLLVGVGNKELPYDRSDVQELELLGHDVWSIVQRRRSDHALARAFERVRLSEARFQTAMEASSEGVWEWTIREERLSFNDPYATMLGYLPSQMPTRIDTWVTLLHPDEAEAVLAAIRAAIVSDAPYYAEFRMRAADGSYRWVLLRGRVVERDQEGKALRAVGTQSDLTARRAAEDALREARDEADAASRAKSSFLAVMSHEIRTPLNGVIAMAEILAQRSLSPQDEDAAHTILASARALLAVIDDILDFSKIEAGRLEIEDAEVSLLDAAEEVVESLLPVAHGHDVDVALAVDPAVPALVRGDPTRIKQMLYNLLGNAIKFSGDNPVTRGRVVVRVAPEGTWRFALTVEDNGIGMTAETVDRLFTSFTQGEASTTRRFGGTGLGLAITKRLVDLMHGEISAHSTPGNGSTFRVILPLTVIDPAPAIMPPDLRGISIVLIRDGMTMSLDCMHAFLAKSGALVAVEPDRVAAAARLQQQHRVTVVVHAVDGKTPRDLLAAFGDAPHVRHVLLSHGERPNEHVATPSVVHLTCDIMRPRRFLRAVAVAAGRQSPELVPVTNARPPIAAAPRPLTIEEARAAGRLILVAEDDVTNQKVILQQLSMLGHTAEIANNGSEALAMWLVGRYALVLTDLHMPEMDGYSMTEAIRSAEQGSQQRTPIVALTANALRGEAARARDAGMDGYVTKPVPLASLRALLDQYVPPVPQAEMAAAQRDPSPLQRLPADSPLLQLSVLAGLIGDDPAVVKDFLAEFQASARALAGEIAAAMAAGNLTRAGALSHRLKSSARAVGAIALGEICAELEAAGANGDGARAVDAHQRFVAMLSRVDAEATARLGDVVLAPPPAIAHAPAKPT